MLDHAKTVIGEEALLQLESAEDYPDVVIGCTGGGSNFSGLSFPFIGRALREQLSDDEPEDGVAQERSLSLWPAAGCSWAYDA